MAKGLVYFTKGGHAIPKPRYHPFSFPGPLCFPQHSLLSAKRDFYTPFIYSFIHQTLNTDSELGNSSEHFPHRNSLFSAPKRLHPKLPSRPFFPPSH